ncbi:hypothetical protein [uncultured Parasphingopyxis sp.]|uniref:hypothetical protein n=1 Tax=uncultured Parasphingopyxis sp. TaxID=1547918 RepID=UPI002607D205|nr:hypothetical protein [uncultured Parasphingopyxis sp.]
MGGVSQNLDDYAPLVDAERLAAGELKWLRDPTADELAMGYSTASFLRATADFLDLDFNTVIVELTLLHEEQPRLVEDYLGSPRGWIALCDWVSQRLFGTHPEMMLPVTVH